MANPLGARLASPPLKRREGALVSVSAFRRSAPKQKPRQGDGARWVQIDLTLPTGLADPSGMQQARYPNAQPPSWLMVAAETSAPPETRRTKKPRRSGAKSRP